MQLIQGEIDAWPTGSAVQVGLPRAEVLVVASACGGECSWRRVLVELLVEASRGVLVEASARGVLVEASVCGVLVETSAGGVLHEHSPPRALLEHAPPRALASTSTRLHETRLHEHSHPGALHFGLILVERNGSEQTDMERNETDSLWNGWQHGTERNESHGTDTLSERTGTARNGTSLIYIYIYIL